MLKTLTQWRENNSSWKSNGKTQLVTTIAIGNILNPKYFFSCIPQGGGNLLGNIYRKNFSVAICLIQLAPISPPWLTSKLIFTGPPCLVGHCCLLRAFSPVLQFCNFFRQFFSSSVYFSSSPVLQVFFSSSSVLQVFSPVLQFFSFFSSSSSVLQFFSPVLLLGSLVRYHPSNGHPSRLWDAPLDKLPKTEMRDNCGPWRVQTKR